MTPMLKKAASPLIGMIFLVVPLFIQNCVTSEQSARFDSEAGLSNSDGTVHLFNGKDLGNFYTYLRGRGINNDPQGVFSVEDGKLVISGEEWGTLITEQNFENYHLVLEFRWGEKTHGDRAQKARDSGVFVHSVGEEGARGDAWMLGIEANIIEGGTGDFIVVGDGSEKFEITAQARKDDQNQQIIFDPEAEPITINSGRINWWGRDPGWKDVKGFHGKEDVENPTGQWNRLELFVVGRHISVILNGILVNQANGVRPYKGKIQIQSEGAEIFFRRIDLNSLTQ